MDYEKDILKCLDKKIIVIKDKNISQNEWETWSADGATRELISILRKLRLQRLQDMGSIFDMGKDHNIYYKFQGGYELLTYLIELIDNIDEEEK